MSNEFIVIEGGGANGLLAIGALKYLIGKGVKPSAIIGTSIGGVIALATAIIHKEEQGDWLKIVTKLEDKFDTLSWCDLIGWPELLPWRKGGIFKNKIARTFSHLIGDAKITEFNLKVGVAICDIDETVENCIRIEGNICPRPYWYKASELAAMTANIPAIFGYQKDRFTGHRIYDGGIASNDCLAYMCNYVLANKIKHPIIYVIRLASWQPSKPFWFSPLTNIFHLFALSRAKCEDLSVKLSELYRQIKPEINVIAIKFDNDIGTLSFKKGNNKKWIETGYEACQKLMS